VAYVSVTVAVLAVVGALTAGALALTSSGSVSVGSRPGAVAASPPASSQAEAASPIAGSASTEASSPPDRRRVAAASRAAEASASATATKKLSAAQEQAKAQAQIGSLTAGLPAGSVSIAALNTVTGAKYSGGSASDMWTASCYKLLVLETLLLQRQQSGGLGAAELAEATRMIENSDNVAGYALFETIGGNAALTDALTQFGMTHTVPGDSDPTFTRTSASDYLVLLENLVSRSSPLTPASQALALGLMRSVEADQRWGVGVVSDPGSDFANKNGWLSVDNTNGPGEQDNDLWIVNSAGVITVAGQQVLMVVMTEHRPSYQDGINLVQSLATAVKPLVSS
jgi:beta-lactamase class A